MATTSFSFTFEETSPPDPDPTPVCGPGTVLENGVCVPKEKDHVLEILMTIDQ